MSLQEQIGKDYIQAMKDRDSVKSSTLSFLRSQLKYVQIEKKSEILADADIVNVIKKQTKQRQDSIALYEQAKRQELADKEKAELAILESYLPKELPDADLAKLVEQAIREAGANSVKDMGRVIKLTSEKAAGQADNRRISEIVKQKLSQS